MIGVSFQDNAVFDMNIVGNNKPLETYYSMLEKQVELFHAVEEDENSEIGTSSNIIPQTLSLNYDMLSKFRLFKWMYQLLNNDPVAYEFGAKEVTENDLFND